MQHKQELNWIDVASLQRCQTHSLLIESLNKAIVEASWSANQRNLIQFDYYNGRHDREIIKDKIQIYVIPQSKSIYFNFREEETIGNFQGADYYYASRDRYLTIKEDIERCQQIVRSAIDEVIAQGGTLDFQRIQTELKKIFPRIELSKYAQKFAVMYNNKFKAILDSFNEQTIEANKKAISEILPKKITYSPRKKKPSPPEIIEEVDLGNDIQGQLAIAQNGAAKQYVGPYQEDRAGFVVTESLHENNTTQMPQAFARSLQSAITTVYAADTENCRGGQGATLSGLFIDENKAYVAWAGDSPIIYLITEKGKTTAHYLTQDHNPKVDEQEDKRVRKDGGNIWRDRVGDFGVNLALTRSVGDLNIKGVSDVCAFNELEKPQGDDVDIVFISGSDGFFNAVPMFRIIEMYEEAKREGTLSKLAVALCNEASSLAPHSDNVTVMVILGWAKATFCFVADGHGGESISEALKQTLPVVVPAVLAQGDLNFVDENCQPGVVIKDTRGSVIKENNEQRYGGMYDDKEKEKDTSPIPGPAQSPNGSGQSSCRIS